ncbi:RecQ family zinc-binding domain-containing protein [Tenacibaculum dicentrarchi]|nr:RecQ family zinc-binding domain-containing protein [Tenacibaculum dicentrarchi]
MIKQLIGFQKNIELYLAQKKKKQQDLIHFLKNNDVCRSVQLLNYFNEDATKKCGICDVCLQHKQTFYINPKQIISLLNKKDALTVPQIATALHQKEANILILLRTLLSEEKISVTNNKYFLL